jgi:xanthine dehydrogenase accessory factor
MDAFDKIPGALGGNAGAVLVTVIATTGSTPASRLSRMLLNASGERLAGTIGGGCVEGDVMAASRTIAATGRSAVMTFTLDEDHPEGGMLCGGTLDVFIEPLSGKDLSFIAALRARRDAGEDSVRGTHLSPEGAVLDRILIPAGTALVPGEPASSALFERFPADREALSSALDDVTRKGIVARVSVAGGSLILELVAGAPSLFIFGGGHISRSVSKIASMAGFSVTVIDDRPEFANPGRFPEAARTIVADFVESFASIDIKPSSSIVIVTRGHKADELVLGVAAATPAAYVGMIGSRKKVASVFERLTAHGVSPDLLRRVRTPIGLDIGAVTPGEIAVAIVAELIHARRAAGSPLGFKSAPSAG